MQACRWILGQRARPAPTALGCVALWWAPMCALLCMLLATVPAQAGRSGRESIHVQLNAAALAPDDTPRRRLAEVLTSQLSSRLHQEFGCTWVSQDTDIRTMIGFIRQRQLLTGGANEDDALETLGRQAKHLVNIEVRPQGAGLHASVVSIQPRRARGQARLTALVGGLGDVEQLVDRFAEQMARLEICAYTGRVLLTLDQHRDEHEVEDRAVYCNGQDQRYRRERRRDLQTQQRWDLQRLGRPDTAGTIEIVDTDRVEETVEDGCHRCSTGREAGRTAHEIVTHETRLTALSQSDRQPGVAYKDATVRLVFEDGDRYFLVVKAVSDRGTRRSVVESGAQGSCDNQSPTRRQRELVTTVPLEELRLGPFQGKATDKQLSGEIDQPIHDPQTGETGRRRMRFDLRRD